MNELAQEVEPNEIAEFRHEVRAWMQANKPRDPGFKLPQSFLEVESIGSSTSCGTGSARSSTPGTWASTGPRSTVARATHSSVSAS